MSGKKCFAEACGCLRQHLSGTPFCNCHGVQDCLNPFTAIREIAQSSEEETETDYIDTKLPDDSDDGLSYSGTSEILGSD